jgi:DNA-binding transcriptional LysR family regulator
MRDLNDLYLFHAVALHRGFTSASKVIGTPKATLSKRVAALESDLGVRLLERTTRNLRLTDVGRAVYDQVGIMLDAAAGAENVAAEAQLEPTGVVRLSCPQVFMQDLVTDILPGFLARYPKVRVQIKIINRAADLVEDGVDIALRARTKLDANPNLIVRKLAMSRFLLFASPAYLQNVGPLIQVRDLAKYATLSVYDEQEEVTWELEGPDGQLCNIAHRPRLLCSSFDVLRKAAMDGSGIALLPDFIAQPALSSGLLINVLPEWYSPYGIIHAVFASRRGLLPALRAMIDFLAEEIPKRVHFAPPQS